MKEAIAEYTLMVSTRTAIYFPLIMQAYCNEISVQHICGLSPHWFIVTLSRHLRLTLHLWLKAAVQVENCTSCLWKWTGQRCQLLPLISLENICSFQGFSFFFAGMKVDLKSIWMTFSLLKHFVSKSTAGLFNNKLVFPYFIISPYSRSAATSLQSLLKGPL